MTIVHTGNGPREAFASGLAARQVPFTEIPVIDFAPMASGDALARQAVGDAVRDACTRVGFFYVKNHTVQQAVIDRTFAAAHRFFDLPLEKKLAVDVANSPNLRGYTKLLGENTDPTARGDLHEGFDLALELPESDPDVQAGLFGYGPNQWPDDLPGFREALLAYHAAMRQFGKKIFAAFALALELDEDHFEPLIAKPMAHMRVLHYPSQDGPVDERQIGIGAHSDYECFTVLCTDDVPALQVLNSAGQWIQAPPIPGAFIVNVGDLMARWTNDYFARPCIGRSTGPGAGATPSPTSTASTRRRWSRCSRPAAVPTARPSTRRSLAATTSARASTPPTRIASPRPPTSFRPNQPEHPTRPERP
jgi:isopenicillin N synthase-like dioxygenase